MNGMKTIHKPKILSVQALRAIAFCGIFSAHSGLAELGAWGVSVFFILSGFVMFYTHGYETTSPTFRNSVQFSVSRIKKLYPLHILTMLSALVFTIYELFVKYNLKYLITDIVKVILNILLIQTWVPQTEIFTSLNGVSWYLSACVLIYCLFPYISNKILKFRKNTIAIVYIMIIFFVQFTIAFLSSKIIVPVQVSDNFCKWVTYICPLFRSGDFAIGCCLGYIFMNTKLSISSIKASILETLAIILFILAQIVFIEKIGLGGAQWFRYTLLYTPSSIALVTLFAINKGIWSKLCTNKVFIYIGNLSAFTFLIHVMVIQYLKFFDGIVSLIALNSIEISIIAFICTIVAAQIWKFIIKWTSVKHINKKYF